MNLKKFLFVIITVLLSSNLYAQTLKLVTLEYPPYEYTHKGKVKGMAVDIVKLIFREMNQPITIEVLPWARAIKYIENGDRDAIFTAFKNSTREKFADYSTELIPQTVSLFVRKDSTIKFEGDLAELSSYSIGVVRKVSYGKLFDNAVSLKILTKIEPVNDGTQNFRRLLKGRVDMVVSNQYGGLHILKQLGKSDEVVELQTILQSIPSYIAFSKKRNLSDIRDKFDTILKKLKEDGRYQKIINSYFKTH